MPGVEPGLYPRQGYVIAVRPHRHKIIYQNLLLNLTTSLLLIKEHYKFLQINKLIKNQQ